jgi:hypothetical protein
MAGVYVVGAGDVEFETVSANATAPDDRGHLD